MQAVFCGMEPSPIRFTLAVAAEAELRERSSRFLAYAYPVADRAAIDQCLAAVRALHPEARHVCYAWRLGPHTYCTDAGEPSGSAGQPILRRILAAELDQVLVVVVRYFGGIKLGVPGLIAAYGQAAVLALAASTRTELVDYTICTLQLSYSSIGEIEIALRRLGAETLSHQFDTEVCLKVRIRQSEIEALREALAPLAVQLLFD
jgi:uncharacterized YigZ family protein